VALQRARHLVTVDADILRQVQMRHVRRRVHTGVRATRALQSGVCGKGALRGC